MSRTSIHPNKGKLNKRTKFTKEHKEWDKKHVKKYRVKISVDNVHHEFNYAINKDKRKDMIDWLESHRPIQTTIKRLISAEMEREKQELAESFETQNKPV